jgi:hypothetical protein
VFARGTGGSDVEGPFWIWKLWATLLYSAKTGEIFGGVGEIASGVIAFTAPAWLFFAWNPGMFRGSVKVPTRSYVLFLIALALSLVYFVFAWSYGENAQGIDYTYAAFVVNITWAAALGWIFFRRWKVGGSSLKSNLVLHWMLFAWLAWFAFPFLGRLGV